MNHKTLFKVVISGTNTLSARCF